MCSGLQPSLSPYAAMLLSATPQSAQRPAAHTWQQVSQGAHFAFGLLFGTAVQQQLRNLPVAFFGCPVQRRPRVHPFAHVLALRQRSQVSSRLVSHRTRHIKRPMQRCRAQAPRPEAQAKQPTHAVATQPAVPR